MRVGIVFYNENHFHPEFFDAVLSRMDRKDSLHRIVGAIFTDAKINFRNVVTLTGMSGCTKLAVKILSYKIKKIFSKPYLNSCLTTFQHYSIDVLKCKYPKEDVISEYIKSKDMDVVFNFSPYILKRGILTAPQLICVNRHASLLPKYKGIEPVFWALLNDEKTIGYSYHEMTKKIDGGRVIFQEEEKVSSTDSVYSLYKKVFAKSVDGFFHTLKNIERGIYLPSNISNTEKVMLYPSREDIRKFREKRRYI